MTAQDWINWVLVAIISFLLLISYRQQILLRRSFESHRQTIKQALEISKELENSKDRALGLIEQYETKLKLLEIEINRLTAQRTIRSTQPIHVD